MVPAFPCGRLRSHIKLVGIILVGSFILVLLEVLPFLSWRVAHVEFILGTPSQISVDGGRNIFRGLEFLKLSDERDSGIAYYPGW